MGSNMVDEIDCGSFFDQIDDLIEFPSENECGGFSSTDCKEFPSIWDQPSDPLFSGSYNNSPSDLSAELSVPYEDIVQLEWLSTFVEDSFSGGGLTLGKENAPINKETSHSKFQSSSPVSVLESSSSSSSSSCSAGKTIPLSPCHRGPQRARSKRPRPATFNPQPAIQLISPTSVFIENPRPFVAPVTSSESGNFTQSPMKKIPRPAAAAEQKTKKKIKFTIPLAPIETNHNSTAHAVRRCMHCEITKTPQWRAGPMGPKTLCNACGVRYKSGRLFPEYRPAASPTFVPSMHSNSHKKVLEMRTRDIPENNTTARTQIPATITELQILNGGVDVKGMEKRSRE